MSTTTIRLDDELKVRISAAAERAGTTTHASVLEAIERTVQQAEREGEFHRLADARWARLLATGKSVSWDEVRNYVAARAQGERTRKPTARKPKAA